MSDRTNKDQQELNLNELNGIAGGTDGGFAGCNRTVSGLKTGYLAMRTMPVYGYGNEMRGHELYNGDQVTVTGETVIGTDGCTYVWVTSAKDGASGYVNASYLTVC